MVRSFVHIFRSYAVLDGSGRHVNGSDRESNHHYGEAYDYLFDEDARREVRAVMEVGNADGSGLLSFAEAFPRAIIVGLDIHPVANKHERVEANLGDATNRVDCMAAVAGRQFDLIVDDAAHRLPDVLTTLLYLWPAVRPGGMYIVEEFPDIGSLRDNVLQLWHDGGGCGEATSAKIVDTVGPFGGVEPLVVLRKPRD